ncbi:hypothetical protein [Bacillus sp. V2I10]|nr:hypothetical protein [Bacillus sp. V2I10]MDQ0861901.1 hypothetical protein [Bacillus sp. V2I10]
MYPKLKLKLLPIGYLNNEKETFFSVHYDFSQKDITGEIVDAEEK